jgi:hypothetical protein
MIPCVRVHTLPLPTFPPCLTTPSHPSTHTTYRFDALKRDAAGLLSNGWRLTHAEGFVLFPGSDHLETLAIFDR